MTRDQSAPFDGIPADHVNLRETEGLSPPVGYFSLCREERHFAAVLYGLMCADQRGLQDLLSHLVSGSPEHQERLQSSPERRIEIYYEYSYLRDLWAFADREPGSPRRRPRTASNPLKRTLITDGLAAFGSGRWEPPDGIPEFNGVFTSGASTRDIMSPATWRLDTVSDAKLSKAAKLLKTAFRIKPDIVIELDGRPFVCFEAKVESGESHYRVSEDERVGQVEMQRLMFERLLGDQPLMVLLGPSAPVALGLDADAMPDAHLTWQEALEFFKPQGSIMYEASSNRLSVLAAEKLRAGGSET